MHRSCRSQLQTYLDSTADRVSLASVTASVRERLEGVEATTTLDVEEGFAEYEVDREVLTILDELITNAIEHDPSPDPTVRVSVRRGDDSEIRFSVSDTGPGLSEQEQRILTEGEETQLSHSSGLGLWMVTWIATYCGGVVTADVDADGTTIHVSVPAWVPDGDRDRSAADPPARRDRT